MSKVVMTWTRDDASKDWVMANRETIQKGGIFSTLEMSVLLETRDAVVTLPGYVSSTYVFPDEFTCVFNIEFDTPQAAESAYAVLSNPPTDSLFYKRQLLMSLKRQQLGLNYQYKIELA